MVQYLVIPWSLLTLVVTHFFILFKIVYDSVTEIIIVCLSDLKVRNDISCQKDRLTEKKNKIFSLLKNIFGVKF